MSRTDSSSTSMPRPSNRRQGRPSVDRRVLKLEALEERAVPAIFTVMNLNDAGADSLRQAILDASGNAENDTILFDAGLAGGTINLATGQMAHNDAGFTLDIQGFAANNVIVDAGLSSRILDNVAGTLSIEGLTLTNGLSTDGGAVRDLSGNRLTIADSLISGNVTLALDAEGGGVHAAGNVTIRNSTIQNNYTAGLQAEGGGVFAGGNVLLDNSSVSGNYTAAGYAEGGGVYAGGNLTLTNNSTISGNRTLAIEGDGGGAYAGGDVLLDNSTVSGNYSVDTISAGGGVFASGDLTLRNGSSVDNNHTLAFGSVGGGIFSLGSTTITNSTISGNSTSGDYAGGGGAFGVGGVTITNSTIAGNATSGDYAVGGGVFNFGTVTITDSTISGNSTASDDAAGGGVYAYNALTITNSTISGNSTTGDRADGGGAYVYGLLTVTNSFITGNSSTGYYAGGGGAFGGNGATITNSVISGNSTTGFYSAGGGLFNYGAITVTNSTLSGNSTQGVNAGGGATFGFAGITIIDSTISGNSTTGVNADGGAIFDYGAISITNSTISGNSTADMDALGGGIYADSSLDIHNSTLSANRALGVGSGGGAAYADGTVTIVNSTISGNQASAAGGGILADSSISVSNSTITGNTAGVAGGGIYLDVGPAHVLTLRNSIVFGNSAATGPDLFRNNSGANTSTIDAFFSALGTAPANGFNGGTQTGNLPIGTDPLLGALADNGGATLTHALLIGSPAIDAGNPAFMAPPEFDQRDTGFPRVIGGRIDIGAYEFDSDAPTVTLDAAPDVDDASPATTYDVTVTYTATTLIDVSTIDLDDLSITGSGGTLTPDSVLSIVPNTNDASVQVSYRFTPPGGIWDASRNGVFEISVNSGAVTNTDGTAVAPGPIGTFTVDVTAPPLGSCSVTFANGVLTVACGIGDNLVEVTQAGESRIGIALQGVDQGAFDGVERLVVSVGSGDDTIRLTNPVTVTTELDGGVGTDTLDLSLVDVRTTVFIGPGSGAAGSFASIENIHTGPADDTFVFLPGADLTGVHLDGDGGVNTFDFSRFDMAIAIDLASGSFDGLTFANINRVIGPLFQPNHILPTTAAVAASTTANAGLGSLGSGGPGSVNPDGAESGSETQRDPHGTSGSAESTANEQSPEDTQADGADASDDPSTEEVAQSNDEQAS